MGCIYTLVVVMTYDAWSTEYSFALAEFYYGKHRGRGQAAKADMLFHASFGRPSIDFVCNHDLVLRLSLAEGHYNTDYQKASTELFPASM